MIRTSVSIAIVGSDHRIEAPPGLAVGEHVMVAQMPSISSLLADPARRRRFAATRAAIAEAMRQASSQVPITSEEIVALVKCARRTTKTT
jgi:hypothetical protein